MISRRSLLAALAACGGLVLTGGPGRAGGIGGTGIESAQGGGIGGTGIIGTLTDFGSIWVNGIEVEIPDDAVIMIEDRRVGIDAFGRGQVVAVRAEWSAGLQRMEAVTVMVRYEVAGPVADGKVLGQTVIWPADIAVPPSGDWVAVSGLRRADDVIVASRFDAWAPERGWLLRGGVARIDDGLVLSGVGLGRWAGVIPDDMGVRASGRWRDGGPLLERLGPDPLNPFGLAVVNLSVETMADPQGRLPAGIERSSAAAAAAAERRVVIDGQALGDRLRPEHVFTAVGIGHRELPDAPPVSRRFDGTGTDRGRSFSAGIGGTCHSRGSTGTTGGTGTTDGKGTTGVTSTTSVTGDDGTVTVIGEPNPARNRAAPKGAAPGGGGGPGRGGAGRGGGRRR